MTYNAALSALLEARKDKAGLSDYELADAALIPRTSIRRLVADPESAPLKRVRRVARVLGTSLTELDRAATEAEQSGVHAAA